ncbi:MAG: type II toxin-antitoxin system RelE/ParE family toxin [Bacteroidota bacterium]
MVKIIWSNRSLTDLQEIGDYISKDSVQYARLTLERIIGTAVILETHPLIGRKTPEINDPSVRELIIGSYRLIYKVAKRQNIYVLTVHHSSRLLRKRSIQ